MCKAKTIARDAGTGAVNERLKPGGFESGRLQMSQNDVVCREKHGVASYVTKNGPKASNAT